MKPTITTIENKRLGTTITRVSNGTVTAIKVESEKMNGTYDKSLTHRENPLAGEDLFKTLGELCRPENLKDIYKGTPYENHDR